MKEVNKVKLEQKDIRSILIFTARLRILLDMEKSSYDEVRYKQLSSILVLMRKNARILNRENKVGKKNA